jgi:hypothetical protein
MKKWWKWWERKVAEVLIEENGDILVTIHNSLFDNGLWILGKFWFVDIQN